MNSEKKSLQVFDKLLFPKIFQTFRMAIQPTKLIIAFLALAVICLAGWIMDFSNTVVVTQNRQGTIVNTELETYIDNPAQVQSYIDRYKEKDKGRNRIAERRGVFSTLWHFASARFHGALNSLFVLDLQSVKANASEYFKAVGWAFKYHLFYCIIFVIIKLAVLSIAGGAICRIAALQFAQDEKPGLTEALRFSIKRFTSFFTAPLAPIGIIVIIGLLVSFLGLIGNIPWLGELLMAIFMPLALIAGTLIAVVAVGTIAGFNLMFPAVAYDGSDCFDAISRSFSYVYAKPWRMGSYTAIAALYGAVCYTFIRFFAFLLLLATHQFLLFGVWVENSKDVNKLTAVWPRPEFMNLLGSSDWAATNWSQSIAAFLIYLFVLVVVGLLVSFIISFYFSANTIIYAALRNKVDNTALDDVYTHLNEVKSEPAATESASEEPQQQPESETQIDSSDSEQ